MTFNKIYYYILKTRIYFLLKNIIKLIKGITLYNSIFFNLILIEISNLLGFRIYWVVRKVRADFEGKLKRRRFKF